MQFSLESLVLLERLQTLLGCTALFDPHLPVKLESTVLTAITLMNKPHNDDDGNNVLAKVVDDMYVTV